jgi:hypothetical protein
LIFMKTDLFVDTVIYDIYIYNCNSAWCGNVMRKIRNLCTYRWTGTRWYLVGIKHRCA